MLTLLPALLLLFAAVVVLVLRGVKSGFGIGWMVSVLSALAAWILVLAYRWLTPAPFILPDWLSLSGPGLPLIFVWDEITWAYAFATASLVAGVLWTSPARFEARSNPITWSANLALGGVVLLATLANSPAAVLIFWGVIDLAELLFMAAPSSSQRQSSPIVIAFSARVLGLLLGFAAFAIGSLDTPNFTLDALPSQAGLLLLAAVGLRLGVLPLHLPFREEGFARRGLGLTMRMAGPAAGLAILPRLPGGIIPDGLEGAALALLSLAALYGASRWTLAADEVEGRPFWIIAAASAAVITAVKGAPAASLGWSLILLLGGSGLFLFSHRRPLYRLALLPALLALSGLPFTPAGAAWGASAQAGLGVADLVTAMAHSFLLIGFVRHALRQGDDPAGLEPWMRAAYLGGVTLTSTALWVDGLVSGQRLGFSPNWWTGAAVAVLSAGLTTAFVLRPGRVDTRQSSGVRASVGAAAGFFNQLFSLSWIYRLMWWLFGGVARIVRAFTAILEGEGGVLWAVLLLALLVSLLSGGGV